MAKKLRIMLKTALLSAIPILLIGWSRTDFYKIVVLGWSMVDWISLLREISFLIGTFVASGYLVYQLELRKDQVQEYEKQRKVLAALSRNLFVAYLERKIRHPKLKNLDIDIFVPEQVFMEKVQRLIRYNEHKVYFFPMDRLSSVMNLSFEVNKNAEGLIGQCYKKKASVIKCQADRFNLNEQQAYYSSLWKFWMCVPFIVADTVVMIASLNSPNFVDLSDAKANQITEEVVDYLLEIYNGMGMSKLL